MRLSSLAENCFNAVERVDEFSHLTPEGNPPGPARPSDVAPDPRSASGGGGGAASGSAAAQNGHQAGASSSGKKPRADGTDQKQEHKDDQDDDPDVVQEEFMATIGGQRPMPEDVNMPPAEDPPADFPSAGKLEFVDAKMRYRPGLPLVLKGLSFTVAAASKACAPATLACCRRATECVQNSLQNGPSVYACRCHARTRAQQWLTARTHLSPASRACITCAGLCSLHAGGRRRPHRRRQVQHPERALPPV